MGGRGGSFGLTSSSALRDYTGGKTDRGGSGQGEERVRSEDARVHGENQGGSGTTALGMKGRVNCASRRGGTPLESGTSPGENRGERVKSQ